MPIAEDLPSQDAQLPICEPPPDQLTLRFRLQYKLRKASPAARLERLRSIIETRQDRDELQQLRGSRDVVWPDVTDPFVTVRIATYTAGERLAAAIESALRQTYANTEILVIGDNCNEPTANVARRYEGDGVRFLNLPRRGQYPRDPEQRWSVAGTTPMNAALELATGDWIAPCDDDDQLSDDHVERLLTNAISRRLEFVWSRAAMQGADGSWTQTAPNRFEQGHVSHGAVLYATALRFMRYNRRAYLSVAPADWELWERMRRAGVRMGFLDELTYYHFN